MSDTTKQPLSSLLSETDFNSKSDNEKWLIYRNLYYEIQLRESENNISVSQLKNKNLLLEKTVDAQNKKISDQTTKINDVLKSLKSVKEYLNEFN